MHKKGGGLRARVLGVDHSPWTQSAMLALHRAGVQFSLSAVPTAAQFRANGYIIPTALLYSEEDIMVDALGNSADIIRRVHALVGGDRLPPLESSSTYDPQEEASRLEELFFEGASERFYPLHIKVFGFPFHFARQREVGVSPRSAFLGAICKAVHCARYGTHLSLMALASCITGHPRIAHPKRTADALSWWESRLTDDAPYLDGKRTMSTSDIQLFGQLQMSMSGLSEQLTSRIAKRPRLLRWIATMNDEFTEYEANRYTARVVKVGEQMGVAPLSTAVASGAVRRSTGTHTCVTLLSLVLLLTIGQPLLIYIIFDSYCKRLRNPHASGKALDPTRYWGKVLRSGTKKKKEEKEKEKEKEKKV